MTKKITYASEVHEIIVGDFVETLKQIANDIANETQVKNFNDQLDRIIDYSNDIDKVDYYSWLMILPLNGSLLLSGLMIGLENDENRADMRAIELLLDTAVNDTVFAINGITRYND